MADLNERLAFLENLNTFISDASDKIDGVFNKLNWSKEDILKEDNLVSCPVQPDHRIPKAKLDKHVESCRLLKDGYSKEDLEDLNSSAVFYEKAESVVQIRIDKPTEDLILSKVENSVSAGGAVNSITDGNSNQRRILSTAQRLAIYQYCVDTAKAVNKHRTIPDEDLLFLNDKKETKSGHGEKSELELKAELRDHKRRRQTYRAKNVHTTKRSHTEVIREVLANQMSILEAMAREAEEEKQSKEKEGKRKQHSSKDTSSRSSRKRSKTSSSESSDEEHNRESDTSSKRRHKHKKKKHKSKSHKHRKKTPDDTEY